MASWLAPKLYVDGDYLTFAELNAAMGPLGDLQWLKESLASIGITTDSGSQTVDSAMVGCRVYGSDQQIPDSVWTEVAWTGQRWGRLAGADQSFLVSNFPTRVHLSTRTAFSSTQHTGVRGYYAIGACVTWAGNATGVRGIRIGTYLAGAEAAPRASKMREATAVSSMSMSITTVDLGNQGGGDDFVCEVYQSSGDDLSIEAMGATPEMWIARLGSRP